MSIKELKKDINSQFISLFDSVLFIAKYGNGTNEQAYKLLKTKLLDKQIYLLLIDEFSLEEVKVYLDDYAYDGKDGKYITITFICQQLEKSIKLNKATEDIKNYGFGAKKFYYSVQDYLNILVPDILIASAQSPDCYHDLDNPLTQVVQELIKENRSLKKNVVDFDLIATNEQLQTENIKLKERITELEQQLKQSSQQSKTPNAKYTTDAMEALNAVVDKYWLDYDPEQKNATKQHTIKEFVKEKYPMITDSMALWIDKIARHPSAK